ncbi:hypothetical protein JTB14_013422 [Gonioctena quinquepunctata]|nr:hypothetical protein JTB14_013422 [Gonioctena quinquepunctata]
MEEENTTNTPVYGDQKESNDNVSMAMDSSLEIKIKMERLIIENECLKRLLEGKELNYKLLEDNIRLLQENKSLLEEKVKQLKKELETKNEADKTKIGNKNTYVYNQKESHTKNKNHYSFFHSEKDHISVGRPQIQGDPSDNEIVPK